MRRVILGAGLLAIAAITRPAGADVTVSIDASKAHQTWFGFGATTLPLIYDTKDDVPADLRALAIAAIYRDVQVTTGNLEIAPYESPATALYSPANDDSDPATLSASGFNFRQSDNMKSAFVDPGAPFGFVDWYLHASIATGFELAWANALRTSNRALFLDECAEHVFAGAKHWRDAYGKTPELIMPFNEPESGNREFQSTDPKLLVDTIAAVGARLRKEGFATMKMVAPNEETTALSLSNAKAILDDPAAGPMLGAIGYHTYPYGSQYASIPNILAASGAGKPNAAEITIRNQLRDLAKAHGTMLFMSEVSHGEVDPRSYDSFRGRAIHIHDEMVYADVNGFFGMNAMWDTVTHADHFAGRDPGFWSGEMEGDVIKIDVAGKAVIISGMGRAIGHYARFIHRGDVRIDATSDDALVQVTAFRRGSYAALDAINNASAPRTLQIALNGVSPTGSVTGEQSTDDAGGTYWKALAPTALGAGGKFSATLPALAVATFAIGDAPISGTDAGPDATSDGGGDAASSDTGDGGASGPDGGGVDASAVDTGAPGEAPAASDSGCGCRTAGGSELRGMGGLAAWGALVAIGLGRRRRRSLFSAR